MAGCYVNGGRKVLLAALAASHKLVAKDQHGLTPIDISLALARGVYFAIECPACGMVHEYPTRHDVPVHNVPCDCGEGQWLLEYKKKPRSG